MENDINWNIHTSLGADYIHPTYIQFSVLGSHKPLIVS